MDADEDDERSGKMGIHQEQEQEGSKGREIIKTTAKSEDKR